MTLDALDRPQKGDILPRTPAAKSGGASDKGWRPDFQACGTLSLGHTIILDVMLVDLIDLLEPADLERPELPR